MAKTFKTKKHLIRVHYQGSTYQTRLVRTERFGPDLRTEPDHQKIKPRTGPEPSKFWNFKPRPDRIRINKIFKISDWFGPVGPLTWRSLDPCSQKSLFFLMAKPIGMFCQIGHLVTLSLTLLSWENIFTAFSPNYHHILCDSVCHSKCLPAHVTWWWKHHMMRWHHWWRQSRD